MTALSNQGLNLHVTHSCRFTVEKRLWRHPLNWESCLKKKNYRFIPKNQRTSKANEQRGANDQKNERTIERAMDIEERNEISEL